MSIRCSSGSVLAHEAGSVIVRGGPILVVPDASTKNYTGNALKYDFDVNSNAQLGLTASYMITDNIGVELLAATPFSHELSLPGIGTVGKTKHLPPSLYLQYYFLDKTAKARPYFGAGVNYTTFFSEKSTFAPVTDLKLKDSWGLALNAGVDVGLTENLFLNTSVWYAKIKTKASFKLGGVEQKADVTLDPMVYFIGLGYRF
ncbi:OmpW family outer membrane protein [Testudinibacter sp. P27/CKL/0425]